MTHWPRHARIEGAVVMIGFGSIGKGTLPLIERHFDFDPENFIVIDPDDSDRRLLDEKGVKFLHLPITRDNYREVLGKHLTAGKGQGFCVNLSVDTSSLDIMRFCREIGALYIDTVIEPWPGFYFDKSLGPEARSNYALRETVLAERRKNPGGSTAVSCCGANPGMVSWFLKQALVNLAVGPRRQRRRAEIARGLGQTCAAPRRQGRPYRRARHPARQKPQAAQRLRQHLVDRGLPVRGHAAGRTRLGHARDMDAAERRLPQVRLRRGDLPDPAGRQYPRALVDADGARPVRLPGHPQRVDLDRRLFHPARRQGRGGLSPDLPLRLPSVRRRGPRRFSWLTRCFDCEGIPHEIVGDDPERPILVARLRGTSPGEALLLMNHVDVVPAGDAAAWSQPPFGAKRGSKEAKHYLYGRGALDMKGQAIAGFLAMAALARHGTVPRRDVVYVAESAEESYEMRYGIGWVLEAPARTSSRA